MEPKRLYDGNDMVKVGCHDCVGCSDCCKDMGTSVILDPYDVYRLMRGLGKNFEQLMEREVELHMEDGLIYPNLKMDAATAACCFLNEQGRCVIHEFRPGICRLFPLGRNYEPDRVRYFLLEGACPAQSKSKVKVSKWLATGNLKTYEAYLVRWHNFTKMLREEMKTELMTDGGEERCRQLSMQFLQYFYVLPYEGEDFFPEWQKRMDAWESVG